VSNLVVRRYVLWRKDPHCNWCGRLTVLYPSDTKKLPEDAATIDHMIDRNDPSHDYKVKQGKQTTVLACRRCNEQRSQKNSQSNRYWVWRKSGRYPDINLILKDENRVIEAKEDLMCIRCQSLYAFDFGNYNLCEGCFTVCVNCGRFFILGEKDNQNVCWNCLEMVERNESLHSYYNYDRTYWVY